MAGGLRPTVGVTTSDRGGYPMWSFNRFAVWRAGGRAVRLSASRAVPFERLDALVVGGGDDIDPGLYGGTGEATVRIDPARDHLEITLLKAAFEAGLPVLGICRGVQMINVSRGGSLHADIYAIYHEAPRLRTALPRKRVRIEAGSRLHAILDCGACRVNALHHQSIDRLGEGLRVVARDSVGIVQAVEAAEGDSFLIGVQWHPEFLIFDRGQQRLFARLVTAARSRRMQTASAAGDVPAGNAATETPSS